MEIDWSVGQIMNKLKNINSKTPYFFTSDNGPWLSFGNHAGSALPLRKEKAPHGKVDRRPCVVYFPKNQGEERLTTMMAIDILPTIAEITGTDLPENKIDGKSVWDIWTGKTTKPNTKHFFIQIQ